MSEPPDNAANGFSWQFGETRVTVTWEAPNWVVRLYATSRLAGPNALVSRREYLQAQHAAFAVMTHVSRTTYSDDTGVTEGRRAARWMRDVSAGTSPDDADPNGTSDKG